MSSFSGSELVPGAATMTVLFTDVVGSTSIRSRLGDDTADALQREHDELVTRVIADQRGIVVKSLGDGAMAVFFAPSEALAAAAGINQALSRRNRGTGEPLLVRMGLSIGEVRVEGSDVFGTPVVEASRLCSSAREQQILVAEHVRILVGSRSPVGFSPVGELDLKGLAGPLTTWEATWWEAANTVAVPLPPALSGRPAMPFVGRRLERFALADAWGRARAGRGPVVIVSGEPGAGASRLVREFARTQHEEGATVLSGRCPEHAGEPFRPFAEMLRHQIAHLPDAQLVARLGPTGRELAALVPELAHRLGASPGASRDPELTRLACFDAVVGWLAAAAAEDPVVLVLEDLERATATDLDLVAHLARTLTPMRALLVATWQVHAATDARLDGVLASLRDAARGVEHIPLSRLDVPAVGELVAATVGEGVDRRAERLPELLVEQTGGVPAVVVGALEQLTNDGALTTGADTWSFAVAPEDLRVPSDLAELWIARLGALDPATEQVARLAAVLGEEWNLDVLDDVVAAVGPVVGADPTSVRAAIQELRALGAVVEVGTGLEQFRFAHGVIVAELRAGLTLEERAGIHDGISHELERRRVGRERRPYEMAHHAVAGCTIGPAVAVPDSQRRRAGDLAAAAANHAYAVGGFAEAEHWWRWALELVAGDVATSPYRRGELSLAAAEAARRHGAEPTPLLDWVAALARSVHDPVLGAQAVAARHDPAFDASRYTEDERHVLEDAVATLDETDQRRRLLVGHLLAASAAERPPPVVADAFVEALSSGAVTGTSESADLLRIALRSVTALEVLDHRRRFVDDLAAVATSRDDDRLRFEVEWRRATLAHEVADRPALDRAVEAAQGYAARLRDSTTWGRWSELEAVVALLEGRLDAALEGAARVRRYRPGDRRGEVVAASLELSVARWRGQLAEHAGAIDRLASSAGDALGDAAEVQVAWYLSESGDRARAEHLYRRLVSVASASDGARVRLGLLAVAFGDRSAADALARDLEPLAGHVVRDPEPVPAVDHVLALAAATSGRADEAQRWFGRAVELHEALGAPLLAAEARLDWARLDQAAGEHERATLLAEQVRAAAAGRGATGLEAQARSLLATLASPTRGFGEGGGTR